LNRQFGTTGNHRCRNSLTFLPRVVISGHSHLLPRVPEMSRDYGSHTPEGRLGSERSFGSSDPFQSAVELTPLLRDSSGYCHRTDRQDFICAERLDGVFRHCDDGDRLTKGIEEFQHTSSRTGGRGGRQNRPTPRRRRREVRTLERRSEVQHDHKVKETSPLLPLDGFSVTKWNLPSIARFHPDTHTCTFPIAPSRMPSTR
jgi:hypothetical protein